MLQEYFDYVPQALLIFQHLEDALRQYLMRCEVMTAARLHGITQYKYKQSLKEIENLSLGRLVDRFARLNGNTDLIMRIKDAGKDRNFIAHQSYLAAYKKDGEPREESDIKALYDRAVTGKEKAEKCLLDTWDEIEQLERKFVEAQRRNLDQTDRQRRRKCLQSTEKINHNFGGKKI